MGAARAQLLDRRPAGWQVVIDVLDGDRPRRRCGRLVVTHESELGSDGVAQRVELGANRGQLTLDRVEALQQVVG